MSLNEVPESFAYIEEWKDACKQLEAVRDELLEKNSVWKLLALTANVNPLHSRSILTMKVDKKGAVTRYKARLVVKGYLQKCGINF